jgi:hypothetical protein
MGQMQTKILDAIRMAVVSKAGVAHMELTNQPQWANTGTVYAQTGFTTLAQMTYSFYDSYCTLALKGPAVTPASCPRPHMTDGRPDWINEPEGITWHALSYGDGPRIERMLDLLARVISEYAKR